MKKYVAYIRVSTAKQQRSGLSFEAQKAIIERYSSIDDAQIVQEYIETESGKDTENRPLLQKCIAYCLQHDCTLVVAKLDRLSRDVEHTFRIHKQLGERLKSCDIPTNGNIDSFTLSIFAGIAQRERELISIRTQVALQAKKARGQTLGKPQNFSDEGRRAGANARKTQATRNPNNKRAIAYVKVCREKGLSLTAIANDLNTNGFKTATGKEFHKATISRILQTF